MTVNLDTEKTGKTEKVIKKSTAVAVILATVILVLSVGLVIGYQFFWNAYDKDTKAEHEFKVAKAKVNAEPNNIEARLALGWSFFQLAKFDKAAEQYQNALKLDPKNEIARFHLALIKAENKDLAGATKDMEALLQEDPKYTPLRESLGLVYLETGEYKKAIEQLEFVNALQPGRVDILLKLGQANEKAGDKAKAKTYYTQAVKYNPNDPEAQQALASLK